MKNKKIIIVVFCFLMLFASSAYAKPSKAKVKKAYKKYIVNEIKAKDPNVKQYGGKAYYYDINQDGIQELFYRKNINTCECNVYTYKKGKVKHAGKLYALSISYNKKKKRICVFGKAAIGGVIYDYKLSGSKLKLMVEYRSYEMWPGHSKCLKNNKEISGKKFDKETKKYYKWNYLC